MRFVLAYASRSRPALFRKRVANWADLASGKHPVAWACAFDTDDATMNCPDIRRFCDERGLVYTFSTNANKVQAINATARAFPAEWDIVIVVSDDMACQLNGWDERIAADMAEHFPDVDGGLWYPDGRQTRLNTLSIMGRKAYESFGHLYDPRFKSVFCDDWYQNQMVRTNRLRYVDTILARHEWCVENRDALMARNEDRAGYEQDRATWLRLTRQ